jgi:cytochrome c oxidase cbb3-type subunit 3
MSGMCRVMVAVLTALAGIASADEPTNPVGGDAKVAGQGEVLFNVMNCDGCHGAGGLGFVGPSLVDGRWRFGGDDAAIFHSIRDGRPHGMPAYGAMLPDAVIWQLVTYLQSQPLPKDVPTIAWP